MKGEILGSRPFLLPLKYSTAMNIQRIAMPVIAALLIATFGGAASADGRSEEDRARDAGRKPFEVVAFIGIEPGMNVLDVMAASGWYTEVLSVAVGPEGHVTAQNTARSLQRREGANEKAIRRAAMTGIAIR